MDQAEIEEILIILKLLRDREDIVRDRFYDV